MTIRQDIGLERKPPSLVALAVALWMVSGAMSVVLIPVTADLVIGVYAAFAADLDPMGRTYWTGVALRQLTVLPLALVAVAVTIGGAEYHLRNLGTPRSWRTFARTLGLELALLIMAWLV